MRAGSPTGRILALDGPPIASTLNFEKSYADATLTHFGGRKTMLRARIPVRRITKGTPWWMFLSMLLITCLAHGQATQGSIFGTVTDLAGAVVPGANVVITSVERGVSRAAVASNSGEYRVSDLDLGSYVVS